MVCAAEGLSARRHHGRDVQRRAPQADALPRRQGGAHAGRASAAWAWSPRPSSSPRRTAGSSPASSRTRPTPTSTRAPPRARSSRTSRTTQLDYWVTGYGTGGTLKGVARVLAKELPNTKIVVCEPDDAPMLTSGDRAAAQPGRLAGGGHPAFKPHPMQGWTPDFIPKLTGRCGRQRRAAQDPAHRRRRRAAAAARSWRQKEGIFVGITAGATLRRRACRSAPRRRRARPSSHAARHRRALSQHAAVRRLPADMTEEEVAISRSTPTAQSAARVTNCHGEAVPAFRGFPCFAWAGKPVMRRARLSEACQRVRTRTSILPKLRPLSIPASASGALSRPFVHVLAIDQAAIRDPWRGQLRATPPASRACRTR